MFTLNSMGQIKEEEMDEDIDVGDSPHKKHKKHKKHKHKKKKDGLGGQGEVSFTEESDTAMQPGIKLKIKIGGQTVENKGPEQAGSEGATPPKKMKLLGPDGKRKDIDVFKTKKSDEDTSDEEKEWLEALESGTLDDNGLIKKAPDPMLMTARQRSKIQGNSEEQLMELPSGYKATEMTEEQLQRRQQRAKKRREAASEKREKDKKKIVDRLLKKQESTRGKAAKAIKARGSRRQRAPGFRYLNNKQGISICVPEGLHFPIGAVKVATPKPAKICGIKGCQNIKKYNCSKTGVPLCSLECYRKNLAQNVHKTVEKVS